MSKLTKKVSMGGVYVGGGESVKIQSMCTVKTSETEKTIAQIRGLEQAGCEIIRVSVLDEDDALSIGKIRAGIKIPIVADIHFSAKLAVLSVENGADKIRINPGNIGGEDKIRLVADCLKAHKIPVRVGANTGSVEKEFLEKYGKNERSLVESALKSVASLEKYGVNDIVVSVKASSAPLTVKAYKLLSQKTDYPLHIGVTEAGTEAMAVVKSSAALGALLLEGIGDTLRVSVTDDPVKEIYVVSCPTCGRCLWNSMELAKKVSAYVENFSKPLKIAVMGCVVNGPGEAKDCDLGIAGASDYCVIFKNGEITEKIPADCAEKRFFEEIDALLAEKQ